MPFQQADTSYDPENKESEGIWILPPKKFPEKYKLNGRCIKLPSNKTLYGMASAPRRFYFYLRGIMLEIGFEVSKFDECLFFWRGLHGQVKGVAGFHVDDGLLAGDKSFYDAMEKVAARIKFGTRKVKDFKFCGVRVRQYTDFSVELDQEESLMQIEQIPLKKDRPDTENMVLCWLW